MLLFRPTHPVLLICVLVSMVIVFLLLTYDYNHTNDEVVIEPPVNNLRAVVMSCPIGFASVYPPIGDETHSKPRAMVKGIEFTARKMAALNSKIPLYVISYNNEVEVLKWCGDLKAKYPTVTIMCHSLNMEFPTGYGFAKVDAIIEAPADEVLWFDCDFILSEKPEIFFEEKEYIETGATFWLDMGDAFDFPEDFYNEYHVDSKIHPLQDWKTQSGFDSGIIVINKLKHPHAINMMKTIKAEKKFHDKSFGDKDLWHLAWVLTNSQFAVVPFSGFAGNFDENGFFMTSRIMYSFSGNMVGVHQIWTKNSAQGCPKNSLKWDVFGENFKKINCPILTMKFDFRTNHPGSLPLWQSNKKDWELYLTKVNTQEEFYFTPISIISLILEGFAVWIEPL